jgi:hypothetical protein
MIAKPTLPTIHMNGTSRADLLEANREAMGAVQVAMAAVCRAVPNGRDYYPQGSDAWKAAAAEHRARIVALEKIEAELEAIALHCIRS